VNRHDAGRQAQRRFQIGNAYVTGRHRTEQRQARPDRVVPLK
jgi:hypothetical protein